MEDKITKATQKPDIEELKSELSRSTVDMRDLSAIDDVRYAKWAGQTSDGRKHSDALPEGRKAFPFEGASDTRVLLADNIIKRTADMLCGAQQRAIVRLNGVELNDTELGSMAGTVVHWAKNRIRNQIGREAELLANYAEAYGCAAAYVGWDQQVSMREQVMTMDEIVAFAQQAGPESPLSIVPEMIQQPDSESMLADMFRTQFPTLKKRDVRKMIRELREEGSTSFPVPYVCKNEPCIRALKMYDDIIVPPETIELQDARVIFMRQWMTEGDLKAKVLTDNWDEKFVEAAINTKGHSGSIDFEFLDKASWIERRDNMIEIFWAYTRSVNEDGIPSIYYTVFSPQVSDDLYGLHEMLPYAHNEYPFIEMKAENNSRRLLDSRGVPEIVKTWQNEVKVQRDSITDYTSFSTLPAIQYIKRNGPVGEFGPAVQIPVTKIDDVKFMMPPSREPSTAFQVEEKVHRQCAEYFGLPHPEVPQPTTLMAQQAKVMAWLRGWAEIYRHMLRLCIQYLAPEEMMRIAGTQEVQALTHEAEKFDISLSFSSDDLSHDIVKERLAAIREITQLDVTGRLDRSKLIEKMLRTAAPESSEDLLLDQNDATKQLYDGVKQDVANMMLGIEADYQDMSDDATATTKLQMVQTLAQKTPSIQERMQGDEMFKQLFSNYLKSLEFGAQQQTNKQIGRQGVAPVQGGAQ